MYCRKCGKEINDEAVICPKCGCETEIKNEMIPQEIDEPKTGIGIVCGLFLGLIGLIIGLCLYKENSIARKTFVKAWCITFLITIIIGIIIMFLYFVNLNNQINNIYDSYNSYYDSLYDYYNY